MERNWFSGLTRLSVFLQDMNVQYQVRESSYSVLRYVAVLCHSIDEKYL